ncbi:MAG TPA: cyclic nucleotide-binding domain-containing protein [Isosphaeraceae bacterium]|jgi:CRP-like cAMP-binding protein
MVSHDAAERFLAAPVLAGLDSASRRTLLKILEERRAPAGAILLSQGEPNDHLAFLIEGTVAIYRTDPRGRQEALAQLTAPTMFGLTSFFRAAPPDFTVRATADAWLLNLDHDAHDRLRRLDLRAAEQLAVAAVRVLADHFDQLDHRISAYLAEHPRDHSRATEWSDFRARLFEESTF